MSYDLQRAFTELKYASSAHNSSEWRSLSFTMGDAGADWLIWWCSVQDDPRMSLLGLVSIASLTDSKRDLESYIVGRLQQDLSEACPYPMRLGARRIAERSQPPRGSAGPGWRALRRLVTLEYVRLLDITRHFEMGAAWLRVVSGRIPNTGNAFRIVRGADLTAQNHAFEVLT